MPLTPTTGISLWEHLTNTGQGYSYASASTNIVAAAETDFLTLTNPAGSGKTVRFWEQLLSLQINVANQSSVIRVYLNPVTVTLGVPITPSKIRPSIGAASIVTGLFLPTVVGRGTLITTYALGLGTFKRELYLSRYLEVGNTLLFTVNGSGVNMPHAFSAAWAEV